MRLGLWVLGRELLALDLTPGDDGEQPPKLMAAANLADAERAEPMAPDLVVGFCRAGQS